MGWSAAEPYSVERLVRSFSLHLRRRFASAAFGGTTSFMKFDLNIELITGATSVIFNIRLFIAGNLIIEKRHKQDPNLNNVVHVAHVTSYVALQTVEWRIEPTGANSSFQDAGSVTETNQMSF